MLEMNVLVMELNLGFSLLLAYIIPDREKSYWMECLKKSTQLRNFNIQSMQGFHNKKNNMSNCAVIYIYKLTATISNRQ